MALTPAALAYARDYQKTQVVPGNVASLLNLAYIVGTAPNTVYTLLLSGTVVAAAGYLAANAQTVDFGGIVIGSATQASTKTVTRAENLL
jgi:N-methylhydantoinase B/oxoprolinase/acetone carboxylase alpha subunit